VADSTYYAILLEVQNKIRGLNLTAIPADNVKIAKVEHYRETIEPGIPGIHCITLGSENIAINGGTNERDDIGYPVGILMFDTDRQDTGDGLPADAMPGTQDEAFRFDEKLSWRQRIIKAFNNQRLTLSAGHPNVHRCTIEPADIVRPTDWLEANLWIGQFVIRCWTREFRGFSNG